MERGSPSTSFTARPACVASIAACSFATEMRPPGRLPRSLFRPCFVLPVSHTRYRRRLGLCAKQHGRQMNARLIAIARSRSGGNCPRWKCNSTGHGAGNRTCTSPLAGTDTFWNAHPPRHRLQGAGPLAVAGRPSYHASRPVAHTMPRLQLE